MTMTLFFNILKSKQSDLCQELSILTVRLALIV